MRFLAALTIAMLPLAAHAECTAIGSMVTCDTPEEAQSLSSDSEPDWYRDFQRNEAETQALIARRNAEEDGYMQGCADAGGRC